MWYKTNILKLKTIQVQYDPVEHRGTQGLITFIDLQINNKSHCHQQNLLFMCLVHVDKPTTTSKLMCTSPQKMRIHYSQTRWCFFPKPYSSKSSPLSLYASQHFTKHVDSSLKLPLTCEPTSVYELKAPRNCHGLLSTSLRPSVGVCVQACIRGKLTTHNNEIPAQNNMVVEVAHQAYMLVKLSLDYRCRVTCSIFSTRGVYFWRNFSQKKSFFFSFSFVWFDKGIKIKNLGEQVFPSLCKHFPL